MFKYIYRLSWQLVLAALIFVSFSTTTHASTQARQFVFNGGLGVFVGTEGLDASFDISLEPEYFFTEHTSLSFRFDITAGGTDSVHFGTRFRYYFDIPHHERINIFVGAGIGGGVTFDGAGFGDVAIPVFGWQYDITKHFKIGSDVSFDLVFNSDNLAFATRLMPVVLKYAF